MAKHPLHEKVGDFLKKFAKKNDFEIRLDPACDPKGGQHIPLFCGPKALTTRLCCVDAMLLKDGKVAVVIEIEESNIKPTQICGKYLTTALSSIYNHENDGEIFLKPKSVNFIQILDTSSPHKKLQFENIKDMIESNLGSRGSIKKYDIIGIDWEKEKNNSKLENDLYNILNGVL
ncbi:MAG: hypothetical protein LBU89_11595 [Fibromonadaceae bacterium]|jgi:hypothetical protein|nr:hypothetical protein [Fibromonadaceae bacterium]